MAHLLALLLATGSLTCLEIEYKLDKVRDHPDLTDEQREEIIELYQVHMTEALGIECQWDAND